MSDEEGPLMAHYLYAYREDTSTGRALAIHYPAANGDAPATCAVCYFWPGSRFGNGEHIVPEPWPCPTVRALLPRA